MYFCMPILDRKKLKLHYSILLNLQKNEKEHLQNGVHPLLYRPFFK